jgi:hypothetical protein
MMYISIRGWRRFQHYDPAKRAPRWIKNYTELLHDPAYLELTEHQALVLHRLWLTYASTRCHLPLTTSLLSRQLGLRVMTRDIDALNHAGFIDIVASKTLADGYQSATPEVEVEKRREKKKTSPPPPSTRKRSKSTPPAPAKVPASLARRDELWDTFDTELGPVATKSERGRRNRALKDLRDIGVTPAQLVLAIQAYRRRWKDIDVTETAIAANWSTLLRPNPNGKLSAADTMAIARGERTLQ